MLIEPSDFRDQRAKIYIVGVGGAGGNAVNRMIDEGMNNVDFVALNTDAQDLEQNNSQIKLQIGKELTSGLGAGADPVIGKKAIEENKEVIASTIQEADMVFIAAGMGGGTGTGAAPEIAKIARENGALTIGIVTKPFRFEGPKRMKRALDGIVELKKNCDTLLVIPNEILLNIIDPDTTVNESFTLADSVLKQAAKGISELINNSGDINTDFADVRATMENMGDAIMGTGVASGEERAVLAAQQAINSPLLQDTSIKGAKNLLLHISGPSDMKMNEMVSASNIIYEEAGEDVNVIFGCSTDSNLDERQEIHITVVATGINNSETIIDEEKVYKGHNQTTNYFDKKSKEHSAQNIIINDSNEESENNVIDKSEDDYELDFNSDNIKKSDDTMLKFGDDDIDIPTFLRNSN
ncbi:MAG: cell division protein FtsZ [Candidatus Marinimicrobia bacterium]|nr:cell division protein FtsZ [Candidatus Neomarinimicrobiota bacterium]|tara:strand:- start:1254 stop:2483 length:1230 start_codon:yes stop_codon:yes gene_type:complete